MGARTFALVAAVAAGLALLAAGCGGSAPSHVARVDTTTAQTTSSPDSSSAPGSTTPQSATRSPGGSGSSLALEYSRCMRSHGVSKFPDFSRLGPLLNGSPKVGASMQQLGVSSSEFQAAQRACRHVVPNGGQPTPAASQRDLNAMRSFATCMRSHGVPDWPDPTNGPAGWGFDLVNVNGFDPNSPQIDNTMSDCQRRLPAGIGIPLSRPGRPG